MAKELAKLRRFLRDVPEGLRDGRRSIARETAASRPHDWPRPHLAIPIPTLPDGLIEHEIIASLELTLTAAARALGVTRAALSTLLDERADLSPEMALRVEKAFGVLMDTLMRVQNSCDIAHTRIRDR